MEKEELKLMTFSEPEMTFFAVKNYLTDDEFYLEEGDEFIYDEPENLDDLDDLEIKEWANEYGYLDEDNGYVDEDGEIDYDSLRERRIEDDRLWQEEYPSRDSSPSGRAFSWFEDLDFSIPKKIKIKIIDGECPGSYWQGVEVKDLDSLVMLQSFLLQKGMEVNFKIIVRM